MDESTWEWHSRRGAVLNIGLIVDRFFPYTVFLLSACPLSNRCISSRNDFLVEWPFFSCAIGTKVCHCHRRFSIIIISTPVCMLCDYQTTLSTSLLDCEFAHRAEMQITIKPLSLQSRCTRASSNKDFFFCYEKRCTCGKAVVIGRSIQFSKSSRKQRQGKLCLISDRFVVLVIQNAERRQHSGIY